MLEPGGTFVVIDKNAWSCDTRRPWLPSVAVKWIDERRGLWMYGHGDPVRERWFRPRGFARRLGRWFSMVRVWHLLSRSEAGSRFPFQWVPGAWLMVLWAATAPGGRSERAFYAPAGITSVALVENSAGARTDPGRRRGCRS